MGKVRQDFVRAYVRSDKTLHIISYVGRDKTLLVISQYFSSRAHQAKLGKGVKSPSIRPSKVSFFFFLRWGVSEWSVWKSVGTWTCWICTASFSTYFFFVLGNVWNKNNQNQKFATILFADGSHRITLQDIPHSFSSSWILSFGATRPSNVQKFWEWRLHLLLVLPTSLCLFG